MRELTIFTGSFKPPHKGHLYIIEQMLQKTKGYVYVFISNKVRIPCKKITKEISKEIFQEYIHTLKEGYRVKFILSKQDSPIKTAYGFLRNVVKKGDTIYLIKSIKNKENKRYEGFHFHGVTIKKLLLKEGKEGSKVLHSTNMRKALKSQNKKNTFLFFPDKMPTQQKEQLYHKLRKLC